MNFTKTCQRVWFLEGTEEMGIGDNIHTLSRFCNLVRASAKAKIEAGITPHLLF